MFLSSFVFVSRALGKVALGSDIRVRVEFRLAGRSEGSLDELGKGESWRRGLTPKLVLGAVCRSRDIGISCGTFLETLSRDARTELKYSNINQN